MISNLFRALAKRVRQLGHSLVEKPKNDVDEYVLEHLMLYHGLVGSTPENQRSFKAVRAEVLLTVERTNTLRLGIALKLPPLWWEDKLKTIFAEIVESRETARAVETLLPKMNDDTWPSRFDPLGHDDWRVRANAASILAFLGAREAEPRMVRALNDSAGGAKCAFPHIASALAKLGADQSRAHLEQFLYSDEPWFRVDAAGALAHWPISVSGEKIMGALLSHHALTDYMAVAVARSHKPSEFLGSDLPSGQAGACAMIIALLDAAQQTFSPDVVADYDVLACADQVLALALERPSPLNIGAALALSKWIGGENGQQPSAELLEKISSLQEMLHGDKVGELVKSCISNGGASSEPAQRRQALALAGELKLAGAVPDLLSMLQPDNPMMEAAIAALGDIGDEKTVEPLIAAANKLVTLKERTALPLSKQPVGDENPQATKAYWLILKALGKIPSTESVPYLIEATSDFAPDKRDQALSSLLTIFAASLGDKSVQKRAVDLGTQLQAAIKVSLKDPSPQVRSTALEGAALLDQTELIGEIVKLTEAAEISVSRKAFDTLSTLFHKGHAKEVSAAVQAAMTGHDNTFRQKQLSDFLATQSRR